MIIKGLHTSIIKIDGVKILKPEEDWDEHDMKFIELNAKTMNILYCVLDVVEFNRIFTCSSAKEIYGRLEIIHESTNQVKQTKINMLVHKYEIFKILN